MTAAREWRQGWPLVLCATVGVMMTGMHFPALGALLRPLTQAYGWTREQASLGLTMASLVAPLGSVLAGAAADRFGLRRVAIGGIILFAPSYALFALAGPALWNWYAASIIQTICAQFVGPVVWTMAVVRHFKVSRGLALAVTLSGAGVMTSLMPGIVLALLRLVSLRETFLVIGVSAALLMMVPAWLLFRRPDAAHDGRQGVRDGNVADVPGLSVRQALRGTRFWRMALALWLVAATVGMFIIHFQSMLIDARLTPAQAASAALIIGPMMIGGRLGTGLLFDRLPTPLVAACAFFVLALACSLMLAFDGGMAMALGVAAVIGLGVGSEVDVAAYLTSRYFGLRRYGVLFGLLIGAYGIGVGTGSALAGRVFDRTGSYDPILLALGIGCALAGVLAATLGRPDVDPMR